MWYRYLDRAALDPIRIWRRCNLRFNADDNGMMKSKNPGILWEYTARTVRSEGPLRGSLLLISIFGFNAYMWYSNEKAKKEAPANEEKKRLADEKDNKKAYDELWFNRFGVASRPNRSINDFMTFLASEKMLNQAFEYVGYEGTVEAYEDYHKGLDGIAGDDDKKMMEYYKQSLKHKSHH